MTLSDIAMDGADPGPLMPHSQHLDSAVNHGLTAPDAIAAALTGTLWLPAPAR
jgi:hypothetical protein